MLNWKLKPMTASWTGRVAHDTVTSVETVVREHEPPTGPPMPRPGEVAPHQDLGHLVSDFIGDLQGAGELICEVLDMPLDQTIGIDGPHRIVDNALDFQTGLVRGVIRKGLKRGE